MKFKKFTTHLARPAAENVTKPTHAVLISISDAGSKLPRLTTGAWLDILSLQFDDVPDNDPQWMGAGYLPPDAADARQIAEFIVRYRDKSVVAHCEQGISRSAAVCAVLSNLGWDYVEGGPSGLEYANPLLRRLLRDQFVSLVNEELICHAP